MPDHIFYVERLASGLCIALEVRKHRLVSGPNLNSW